LAPCPDMVESHVRERSVDVMSPGVLFVPSRLLT
jgi:hypothetical protein